MVVIPSARYIALGRSCGGSRRSPAATVITLKPRKAKKVSATLATIFEKDGWSLTASLPRSISTHERSWSWFALRPTMFRVARRRLRAGVPRRSRQERNYVATKSRESVKTADLLRGFYDPTRSTLFVRSRASDRAGRTLDGDFTPWLPFAPAARPDQNGLDGPDFFLMERNMLRGFTQRAEDLASQERERARA